MTILKSLSKPQGHEFIKLYESIDVIVWNGMV